MPKRVDRNQAEIVKGLRKCGVSVQSLSGVGHGCPDLLCGYLGADGKRTNLLFEVKGEQGQDLTIDERRWHLQWNGVVHIIRNLDEAIAVITRGFQRKTFLRQEI